MLRSAHGFLLDAPRKVYVLREPVLGMHWWWKTGLMNVHLFRGLLPLQRAGAAREALAGVVLAAMDIPQVLGYSKIALHSSSTSIGCVLPMDATAVTRLGIMLGIHWIRSRLCGHWLISTPPPSPAQVARQPPLP